MEPVVFSCLKYRGTSEALKASEVKAAYGESLSLNDARPPFDKEGSENVYIIVKFVKILVPIKWVTRRKVLTVLFKTIRENDDNSNVKPKLLRVYVFDRCAEIVEKAISEQMIKPGDIVTFHRPTMKMFKKNQPQGERGKHKLVNSRLYVKIDGKGDQLFNVWHPYSDSFIESVRYRYGYNYLVLHDMDCTGSMNHAVRNLLHLVRGRGSIVTMREIAIDRSPQKKIVFAQLQKILCSPTNCALPNEVTIRFKQILITPASRKNCLDSIFSKFTAMFSGELAKEMQKAVTDNHLAPGDIFALCNPKFENTISSPIKIEFSLDEEKPLVIIKYQNSDIATSLNVAKNLDQSSNSSATCIETKNRHIKFLRNTKLFCIAVLRDCTSKVDVIQCISNKLGNYFKVDTIENLYKFKKYREKRQILAYFLKTINYTNRTRTVLFLKEICPDHTKSKYFTLVMYNKIGEEVGKAIKNKSIIRNDILSLISPVIHPNGKFTMTEFASEEPYILEMGAGKDEGAVIAWKVGHECKASLAESNEKDCQLRTVTLKPINTTSSKRLAGVVNSENISLSELIKRRLNSKVNCQLKEHLSDCQKQNEKKIRVLTNQLKQPEQYSPVKQNSLEFKKTQLETTTSLKQKTAISEVKEINENCSPNNMEVDLRDVDGLISEETKINSVFPVCVTRPFVEKDWDPWDLVSGYCKYGCQRMHIYHTIRQTKFKEYMCPKCDIALRMVLCFEMSALTSSGMSVKLLLIEKEAERFLNITVREFINDEIKRIHAVEVLEKIDPCKLTNGEVQCKLELSDATYWEICR